MSRNSARPFLPCGSYQNKSAASNAILDITDGDQKWEVGPPHTYTFVNSDDEIKSEIRYSIQRVI